MTKLHELARTGQAVWFDYIRRSFLVTGELQRLVDQGVRGVTSNPTIFEKAIAGSADYDAQIAQLVRDGAGPEEIYETLAVADIRHAADILRPVYDETAGADGYVSLEVSPTLARDTDGTVDEARRLFAILGRPNAMIKVPATAAGIPAIETLIGDGINVNVTLIFSLEQYEAVAGAYLAGLERWVESGGAAGRVASVASFFVSRVDTALDPLLEKDGEQALQGRIAVDNARLAYARFRELFSGARWQRLEALGARPQRPLWASTGTKNPSYSDTLYVDELIGQDTVNTLPPATLQAFMEHGVVARTVDRDLDGARQRRAQLAEAGIDLGQITRELQDQGVAAFARSFADLMDSITEKRAHLAEHWEAVSLSLGEYADPVRAAQERCEQERMIPRLWQHDHTLWSPQPTEITDRLGWLATPEVMRANVARITEFVHDIQEAGFTKVVLLGMGGSSLAPEVVRRTFGTRPGFPDLEVLDSTHPDAVRRCSTALDPEHTLFLVSTKSGGTVETLSLFKYFHGEVARAVGAEHAGQHFVAVTDPGSGLEALARQQGFRATFLNDPNIGGRYSALSFFGLVPAALVGVDLETLLGRALTAADNCEGCNRPLQGDNHGAQLGAALGALAARGRDKLTLVTSPELASFGDWLEQLIAESLGKHGKGIVPVVGEALAFPDRYGPDRVFVHLRLEGDDRHDAALAALTAAGHPLLTLRACDRYDLGYQFFLWEVVTAVAGAFLAVNPFDQPDVESAKARAKELVANYREDGRLPDAGDAVTGGGLAVYGARQAPSPEQAVAEFLAAVRPGDYVALQAYLPAGPPLEEGLQRLRQALGRRTGCATTLGYGPRFLHSTGQLHKGDGGNGVFLQLVDKPDPGPAIPDAPGAAGGALDFGTLIAAQALGDRQALLDKGRRVLRVEMADAGAGLERLLALVGG